MCDIVNIIAVIFLLHSLIKKKSYSPIPKQQTKKNKNSNNKGKQWYMYHVVAVNENITTRQLKYTSSIIPLKTYLMRHIVHTNTKKWIDCQIRRIIEHAFLIKIQYNFLYIFYSYNYLSPIFRFLYSVNVSFINGIYLLITFL